ncbi:MAG: hydrogenase maturation protease [Bryobacteraceae bacterium]|nr:hydrogenase maturation protease [Bryobacteraceae bacterium]
MKKPLIIGYGNPLRGDDALGIRAAEKIELLLPPRTATVITCQQLTPELASAIAEASEVWFLDAGLEIGVRVTSLSPAAAPGRLLTHYHSPESLLAFTQDLYGDAPPAKLVVGSAFQFGPGERLSERACRVVEEMAAVVAESLAGHSTRKAVRSSAV